MLNFKGLMVGLATPFTEDDLVDKETLGAAIRLGLGAGVHGFFPLGSVGQGPHMTPDERKDAAEFIMNEIAGRAKVILQVGTADTRSTIDLARHAVTLGVEAIGVLPLYYGIHSEAQVLNHYRRVAEAIDLPILVYDNQPTTQFRFTAPFIAQLVKEVPSVSAVKMSTGSMMERLAWLSNTPSDFCFLDGWIEYLTNVLPLGAKGVIEPRALFLPELCLELWQTASAGDWAKAVELQAKVTRILATAFQIGGMATISESMRLRGIPVKKWPRSGSGGSSEELRNRLREYYLQEGCVPADAMAA